MRHKGIASVASGSAKGRQRGIVLVSAMIILVVLTLLAISSFRSFGLQERIAGNTRDKQMAFQVAQETLQYGEWWLTKNGATPDSTCPAGLNTTTISICSTTVTYATFSSVPWGGTGTSAIGFSVNPAPPNGFSTSGGTNTYAITPRLYIFDLGGSPIAPGVNLYQVTAMAEGGKANSVAVVQSIYSLQNAVKNLGGL